MSHAIPVAFAALAVAATLFVTIRIFVRGPSSFNARRGAFSRDIIPSAAPAPSAGTLDANREAEMDQNLVKLYDALIVQRAFESGAVFWDGNATRRSNLPPPVRTQVAAGLASVA